MIKFSIGFTREIFCFAFAGVIGFLVDSAVLYLLRENIGLYYARLFSFVTAVITTWIINRNLTFRKRKSGLAVRHEFSKYFILMLAGGVTNYAVYAGLIIYYQKAFNHPIIGVAAGSLAGMLVNFTTSRSLVFRSIK